MSTRPPPKRPPGGGLSINSTAGETSALQPLRDRRAQVARRLHRRHPRLLQRRELAFRRARAARRDRTRMPHALALRRAGAGDEADDRLGHVLGDELGRFLFGRTADLADHDDRSEEHTSELQSLMRISYAVFCLKKKNKHT